MVSLTTFANIHYNPVPHTTTDTGAAVISVGEGKLPWVFTPEQRELVDSRCRRVVMPHNCHAWCTTKEGILKNTQTCWRMVSKILVFFMLPVLFRGTVDLHRPLTKLVHALRLLLGRVISEKHRRRKGWLTCFHHISSQDLKLARRLVPESMSEYVNVTPPSCAVSHMHQIVHYPRCVDLLGSLSGCWMFGDERRNKVIPCMRLRDLTLTLSPTLTLTLTCRR